MSRTEIQSAVFFVVFALVPGLTYQWVQDDLREGADDSLRYWLGIAPNFLGALSLAAALAVIFGDRFASSSRLRLATICALISLFGLWAWEVLQIWLPNGTFDLHDIAWTVPGALLSWAAIASCLPRPFSQSG